MSTKINVFEISEAHFQTLRHHGRDELSIIDVTVFFICPAFLAIVVFMSGEPLADGLVGAMINAAAILLGLLLNLLVLMFDQKNRAQESLHRFTKKNRDGSCIPDPNGMKKTLQLRIDVISETVANISFTVLLCIASLCTLLLHSMREATPNTADLFERIIYAVNAFIWVSVSLIILMVIKRVFALFSQSH